MSVFRRILALGLVVLASATLAAGQEPGTPPPTPVQAPAPQEGAPAAEAAGPDGPRARRQDTEPKKRPERPKKPRRGIPVTEPLVDQHCSKCHKADEKGQVSRISYMRKSPEGWEISLKRMIRLHEVELTPDDARAILRYLANDHGLTRAEAERGLYEAERRVHWSEEHADEDMRKACAACHSLGRVLAESREEEEWKQLKATHLAMFPLADFQAFRGRSGRGQGEQIDWENLSEAEIEEAIERQRERERAQGDRADRVLKKLAVDQPLFSKDWEAWRINRREVPLADTWTVTGHEVGRARLSGTVKITRTGVDSYATEWHLDYGDGRTARREGKGLLYAGYSWRGRSSRVGDDPSDPADVREVFLLGEDWNHMKGRVFSGGYNELGADVELHRHTGATQVFDVLNGAAPIPSNGHVFELVGEAFPPSVSPVDFHLGSGITVRAAERVDERHVRVTADVSVTAENGLRRVSYRARVGPEKIVLYDTIDYVKVYPEVGFSRVGGKQFPKQLERFEALAMHRGPDDKPYTADDVRLRVVPVAWSLEEFPVRENDDDVQYVGALDATTGVFTPAIDGPNPERHWQANNVGDVYVVATCSLEVRKLPERKKKVESEPAPEDAPAGAGEGGEDEGGSELEGERTREAEAGAADPDEAADAAPEQPAVAPAPTPVQDEVVMETRTFRSRGHLLVTIPLYVRWDVLEWRDE